MGTAREARQSQAGKGAPRERDRQRWATADAPRPRGGLGRVPGQVPAHAAATPLPVASPIPLLPQIAAPSMPAPGGQLLEARRRLCKANSGVPSLEVPPPTAHDADQRRPARAARPAADLRLARLQGLVTQPAPGRPPPGEGEAQKRPSPRPVPRTCGRLDCQLPEPRQDPRHTGQHPPSGPYALDVDVAIVRLAHASVPPTRHLLVQTVQQQVG